MPQTTEPLSDDEKARLDALDRYAVLDTEAEPAFDRIVELARVVFDTPMALVSFVDQSRQWFKARTGVELQQTSRAWAFCEHAIRQDGVMVVDDANQDPRFADNPLVTGSPRIRFYAGAPITTPDGHKLGTVCVLSDQPRTMSPVDRARLTAFAGIASSELELRLAASRLAKLAQEREFLLQEIDHRLQNSLHLVGNILREQARNNPAPEVRRAILAAADRVVTIALISRELRSAGDMADTDTSDYLLSLCEDLQVALIDGLGGRKLAIDIEPGLPIPAPRRARLGFVLAELISNAVKHGRGTITLSVRHDGTQTLVRIRDEGDGFSKRHLGPAPEWGAGLRLVQAISGGTIAIDRNDRNLLQIAIPDAAHADRPSAR